MRWKEWTLAVAQVRRLTQGCAARAETSGAAGRLPLLHSGSTGGHVRAVQALLNGLGHNAGTVDGLYGDNTAGAVKRFQLANSLAADGIVGRDTWHRLLGV